MATVADLPGSLRHAPAFAFVGRNRELDELRALVPLGSEDPGRAALIWGEPGAGKSRLVRELASHVAADGVSVLYGACDAAVRAPYRPFVEALDRLRTETPAVTLPPPAARELARLLPGSGPLTQPAPSADPDTERHRLHVAVAELLSTVSRHRPMLLVLEDLHWADGATLLLLRHLARAVANTRVLLVVTYRDLDADATSALNETLVDIRRHEGVARVRLTSLSTGEIEEFARCNAGAEPAAELVSAMAELTGGNPFFLTELWRELVETGALEYVDGVVKLGRPADSLRTPEAVRAVVSHRLERLSAAAAAGLEVAAVAGSEFELATLRAAAGLSEGDLLDAIDEATRSGLISEIPGRGLAYRFAHELVRLAVTDRLSSRRRAEIHLAVAEALADSAEPAEQAGQLAALAHHFAAAAAVGGRERAVDYCLLAAQAAAESLAFDESAERLRTALALGIPDPNRRTATYLELGRVSHRGGKSVDALNALRQAADLARGLGDARSLAKAAITFEQASWRPAIHEAESVELLREAVSVLPVEEAGLRTQALGGLARALELRGDSIAATRAREESVAIARRSGDRRGLALTLAGAWSSVSSSVAEINAMLTEALHIGEELGDSELTTEAMGWLVPSYVALCDHRRARRMLARLLEAARRQRQPFYMHVAEQYASALNLCDGLLDEAEAAALRSHEWSRLLTGADASGVHGIQMFSIRREQGRLGELMPVIQLLAGKSEGAWRPGLVAVMAELGMTRQAQQELRRAVADELDLQRRLLWLASLSYLTDAATLLRDAEAAERLYPELARHEGGTVLVGHLVSYYGAGDRYLGMLAGVLGEWERGEEHFAAAAELNRRLEAPTWLAHTLCEHGLMLIARGRARDKPRAQALLDQALTLARQHDLSQVIQRVLASGIDASAERTLADGLSTREVDVLRLLARGMSNREIGSELFISEHTTASHVRSILRKTGCANRTEAAAYAHRQSLLGEA